ncbi:MAG: hypothetical protein H3C45_01125 [Bacteroidia bacterium]|nr:hypothetical protein [Bacteroidia bacterium]MCZ2140056.1 ribonuclease H-like YkuK family protein [Bacteroidia bacterium]
MKANYQSAPLLWRRFNGQTIDKPIVEEVERLLIDEIKKGNSLKVCIGTDSQVYGSTTEFATVIVFLRKQHGGFMLICNEVSKQKLSIKERMLLEVSKSIDIAYQLCHLLDEYQVELEVHADINTSPNFKSNTALNEAMGYILGMGFVFKAKPDAFASSYCANRMVH